MYANIVTFGCVVESATAPDDISTMEESSQDESSTHETISFEGFSIPNHHEKGLYATHSIYSIYCWM